MSDKQQLLDDYTEFLIYKGFDIEGKGYFLKGSKVEDIKKEELTEVFELVDELNKKTQEFKSKFYEVHDESE